MKNVFQIVTFALVMTSASSAKAAFTTESELNLYVKEKVHTPAQLKILKSYSDIEYSIINHALRTKDRSRIREVRNQVCSIDKLMTTNPRLKNNLQLYRGHYFLPENGEKIGFEFNAETFVSTSLSKKIALKFAEVGIGTELSVLDTIEVDPAFEKHLWLSPYSKFKEEKEVLLDRNLRFRVVSVKKAIHPTTKSLLYVRTLNVVDNKKNEALERILNCPK